MRICLSCDREYKESSRHKNCPICRAKAAKDKICPNCGEIIQRKSTYCNPCNNKLFPNSQKPEITAVKFALKKIRNSPRKNREYNVTTEFLTALLEQQDYKCAYTNLPMELPNHRGCLEKRLCASLDRIDSSKGYIEGNVQWVITPINFMKNSLGDEEFRELLT